MADNNRTELVDTGARKQLVEQNNGLIEEVKMLKQHMADMYRAWMTGKVPPPPPPSLLDVVLTQAPNTMPDDPPYSPDLPAYYSFPNRFSSSITHPPITSPQNRPPITSTIPDNEYSVKAHDAQYYPSEVTHKVPNSYNQGPRDGSHVVNEEFTGRKGRDGIPRRLKGIEQSSMNKQGTGDQGSISYKELSMSPDVYLPARFKVPKFNLYDGCGDLVAHLRDYCNKMRSVGEKDDLLMAYPPEEQGILSSTAVRSPHGEQGSII
ncbi:uncharacterized protein [Nicotiana sylvestris]|uniref:uncharacterized protein n=1 Tax=Nicotiana sylvestris TaxID=4096 RepID=UPI00388C5209